MGVTKINEICTSLDKNLEVFKEKFEPILSSAIGKSLRQEISNSKDTLTKLVENVVNEIIEQMNAARENGFENSTRASNAIDNTRALAENIERLNEQKQNLVEIKSCVEPFHTKWSENIKNE